MGNDTIDRFLGDNGLIPINVPSLDSPSYVSDWNDAFQNVKTNLATLANRDFVKGETGDSSSMDPCPLIVNENLEEYQKGDVRGPYLTLYAYQMLRTLNPNFRYKGNNETLIFPMSYKMFNWDETEEKGTIYEPVSIEVKKLVYINENPSEVTEKVTYHWYSQFLSENNENAESDAGKLYIISKKNGLAAEEESSPYSSLYYTFLDYRFYNENVGSIGEETYETLEDLSCVLNLVPDNKTAFTYKKYDAFPTMYYEENAGLCWRINGSKTGMPIRGIPGEDGKNALLYIVKAERTKNESECEIIEIFDNGFKKLSDVNTIKNLNGQSAIVFVPSDESNERNDFYFSKLYLNDSDADETKWRLTTYCMEDNALNTQIAYNEFINVLKAINLYKADTETITTLKGLFIPIQSAKEETVETDSETESTVSATQAVHLMTAVTNEVNASEDEEKPNMLFTPVANINSTNADDYKLYIDTYLYLEYDKTQIYGVDDGDEYTFINGWGDTENRTHMVKHKLENHIDNIEAIQTLEADKGLPEELVSAIKTTGIYHWKYNGEKNIDYDVQELINAFNGGYNTSVDREGKYVSLDVNDIYTTTATPGVDTDFYWYCKYPNNENEDNEGWTTKKFIFKKLVPIVNGASNAYAKDTTLNLNYNVNVLGDNASKGSHNLTVHGNISSNSANIYGSISANDYKNINTSTVIRGNEGIELGIAQNEETKNFEPAFIVDVSGSIIKSKDINTNAVITGNVEASGNITGADISCQNFKLARNRNIGISAEIISTNNTDLGDDTILNNSSNVYINNAHHLKISKNENLKNITKENINSAIKSSDLIPHINSGVPLFINDNANIIVTNSSDIGDVYVEYSNTGTMPLNFRKYKSKENGINSLDFNATKDYSLYKTTDSKKSSIINQSPTPGSNPSNAAAPYYDVNPMRSSWISDKNTWTLTANKDRAIAKFTIVRESDNDVLVNNIKFNLSEYILYLGIYGRCHYGKWPQLKSDSNIKLTYYLGDDNAPDMSNRLFEDTTTYSFKDTDCAYTGINHKSDEYGGKERYYYFKFAPYSKTVYSSSAVFAKINNAFQTNKSVTIWVVPTITLSVQSENYRNTYKQIIFKGFKYYNTTSANSSNKITKTTLTSWPSGSYSYVTPTCEYSISRVVGEDSEHKATTICDNGIVFTSGNYLFGIGYGENIYNHSSTTSANRYARPDSGTNIWGTSSNPTTTISGDICLDGKPMLFYVDVSKNGVSDWINSVNSNPTIKSNGGNKKIINFNYNRAINAIPLEDIFNVIRYVRTQHDDWKQFGL